MRARSPASARFLGLWTAGWLAVLLVLGMVRFGDPTLQWPVLLVPAAWALVALRPRRAPRTPETPARRPDRPVAGDGHGWPGEREDQQEEPGGGRERWADERPRAILPTERTDTVERPAVRRPARGERDRW